MWAVEWVAEAQQELARIWAAASAEDRRRITIAVDLVDRLLSEAPLQQGESRRDQNRVMFASPMGITFDVVPLDRRVTVLGVWRYKTR